MSVLCFENTKEGCLKTDWHRVVAGREGRGFLKEMMAKVSLEKHIGAREGDGGVASGKDGGSGDDQETENRPRGHVFSFSFYEFLKHSVVTIRACLVTQLVKNTPAMRKKDLGAIPGLGRSPGEGKGYPLQYSGLENSVDYTVHEVTKSRTRLSNFHFHFIRNSI